MTPPADDDDDDAYKQSASAVPMIQHVLGAGTLHFRLTHAARFTTLAYAAIVSLGQGRVLYFRVVLLGFLID